MKDKLRDGQIIIVNQASNYLTVDICNAFAKKYSHVTLMTATIHEQGQKLDESISIDKISKWSEGTPREKLKAYLIACFQIYRRLLFKYRKHEVFFISLPPMAYLLTIILPQRCSVLIWDVYPDVLKITGMKPSNPVYRVWASLNRIAFNKTNHLFTIGNRMADLLASYADRRKIQITPIWSLFDEKLEIKKSENPFVLQEGIQEKFIVQYSGNIGLTHNVEVMIDLAEIMKEQDGILFQIIGKGSRVPFLKTLAEEKKLTNCIFLPFQSDEMFPYSLSAADIGVVILDESTSKGSVPSKSYNLMSFGTPSLYIAGTESELHDYAQKYEHALCVNHDNLMEAAEFILKLSADQDEYEKRSANALAAAENYKRNNAEHLVDLYVNK